MTLFGATARRADPADLDAVVDLCLAARAETALTAQVCSPSRETIRTQLATVFDLADMRLLVAELDGVRVGFALARVIQPGLFSDAAWMQVEALFVDERQRRRGAGHALMAELGRLAVAEGAERVVTVPLTGSRSEQRFLARLGFAAAAAHRIVDTTSLVRRLELETVPRERRRPRGLENLIATRRRTREVDAVQEELPLGVGVASSSTQVSRAVQSRR